jgi:hypothetical protein
MEGEISDEYMDEKAPLSGFWDGLYKEINRYIDSVTINDLIEDSKITNEIYEYYI